MVNSLDSMQVYNYPVVNHGRQRGLLQRLRSRLLYLQGERSALQQQVTQLSVKPGDSQLHIVVLCLAMALNQLKT